MLLPLLILASLAYVAYAVSVIIRAIPSREAGEANAPHPAIKFAIAGGVPLVVTATMAYFFWMVGGATTVQFNAGSPSRMNVWSTWVDLFPMFLFITAASGLGSLIWLGGCVFKRAMRPSISAAAASLGLSVLAFFTVLSYFPTA
jgi:hypothetical protein